MGLVGRRGQFSEYFRGFVFLSGNGVGIGEIGIEGAAVSRKGDRFPKFDDCFIGTLLLYERLAQFIVADGKILVQLEGLAALLHGFVVESSNAQRISQIRADDQR
jgi:hypothetical protein